MIEAAMVSTTEECTNKILIKPNSYVSTKNPSARKLLCKFTGVGIYFNLIPDWIKSNWAQTLFPAQCKAGYRAKFEILIREVFQYII